MDKEDATQARECANVIPIGAATIVHTVIILYRFSIPLFSSLNSFIVIVIIVIIPYSFIICNRGGSYHEQ